MQKDSYIIFILFATLASIGNSFCIGTIEEFNYKRDRTGIINNLREDIYWLIETPETFDIEYMLRTKSPNKIPALYGKLNIKVLRDNNQLVGFVAYYKLIPDLCHILFLSVNKAFRGKNYGKKLLNCAIHDLFRTGCSSVNLIVRTNNTRAKKIYKDFGFKESYQTKQGFTALARSKQ